MKIVWVCERVQFWSVRNSMDAGDQTTCIFTAGNESSFHVVRYGNVMKHSTGRNLRHISSHESLLKLPCVYVCT
jgi:hypothetical protein